MEIMAERFVSKVRVRVLRCGEGRLGWRRLWVGWERMRFRACWYA